MALLEAIPGLNFPPAVFNPAYVPRSGPQPGGTQEGLSDEIQDAIFEPTPHELLDQFFHSRQFAAEVPGVRGARQEAVRNDVHRWFGEKYPEIAAGKPGKVEDYAVATTANTSMLGSLLEYLQDNHFGSEGISGPELYASQDFLSANFALHEGVKCGADLFPGKESHAFVVPVRLSTSHPEYSDEIRPLVPAFHYVPDEVVPHFMRDLPPFVADRYVGGGYVVVAPVTDNMAKDLAARSVSTFRNTAQARVNEAITLADALGGREFGLGATFPGLMALGEKAISEETTTGHGGTTALMMMLIKKLSSEVMPDGKPPRIGVLGLGQIGLPAAEVVADFFPESRVNVFDIKPTVLDSFVKKSDSSRFSVSESIKQLIEDSDIILSTITTTLNFEDPNDRYFVDIKSLEGKYFIDDSEPHGLRPEQVIKLGGVVLDVVGRDYSGRVLKRDSNFGYGGTLANGELDAFGCELEVALLAHYRGQLIAKGYTVEDANSAVARLALRRPVTAQDTRNWINLFRLYGIGPAPFQVFGKEYRTVAPNAFQRFGRKIVKAATLGSRQYSKVDLKLAA